MSAIDVNEAFRTERLGQIEMARQAFEGRRAAVEQAQADFRARVDSGKLVPLGGGSFRVNDPGSWDDGEVWRNTVTAAGTLVLPVTQLDESSGRVALYSRVPAWHGLGSIVPEGVTDIDQVLELGAIGFQVEQRPVEFRLPILDTAGVPIGLQEPQQYPDRFINYRTDTGAPLGDVGKRYTVFQNRRVFEFLQDLVNRYDVTWESAGALRGGSSVFVSMRLPEDVTIELPGGGTDTIIPFIVGINTHDGSGMMRVVVTPWRPVCGNTERFAVRDAVSSWAVRHTSNGMDRWEEARRTLGLSVKYFGQFAKEEQALADVEFTLAQFRELVDGLWEAPADDAPQRAKTIAANRDSALGELWSANAAELGPTAYAAERTITEYSDWKRTVKPIPSLRGNNLAVRATAMIEGADDDLKVKAHRKLLTLTHR